MASEPIHIHDDSALPRIVDEATERPVRFERHGVVYRLSAEDPVDESAWTDEDREAVLKSVAATAGAWSEIDADKVIEDLYDARRTGSRPESRP